MAAGVDSHLTNGALQCSSASFTTFATTEPPRHTLGVRVVGDDPQPPPSRATRPVRRLCSSDSSWSYVLESAFSRAPNIHTRHTQRL